MRSLYHTPEWRALRCKVLVRDRYQCVVCGRSVRGWRQSRVDHIKPVSTHPELAMVIGNLRTLCPTCDNRRHIEKGGGKVPEPVDVDGCTAAWRKTAQPIA